MNGAVLPTETGIDPNLSLDQKQALINSEEPLDLTENPLPEPERRTALDTTGIKEMMRHYDLVTGRVVPEPPPFLIPEPPPVYEVPIEPPPVFVPEPPPEIIPEPPPVVVEPPPVFVPEPSPVVEAERTFEEEWGKFEKLRNDLATTEALKGNFSGDTGIAIEDLRIRYASEKERMAGLLRKKEHKEWGQAGPFSQQEEKDFNDHLFEELVKKENDAYLNALRENRKETWKDTVVEGAKNLLGTKTVQWYMGLSKTQKMAINFGIGSIAGLAVGLAAPGIVGAVSYLGWRAARIGLSGSASIGINKLMDKKLKSIEDLNKDEEEEIEDLKNSELSLEEKSKGLLAIEKEYKKIKIGLGIARMGATVLAGAGTGALVNLAEGLVMGTGGGTRVVEAKSRNVNLTENKLAPRKGFEQSVIKEELPAMPKAPSPPTQAELDAFNKEIYASTSPVVPKVEPPIQEVVVPKIETVEPASPAIPETKEAVPIVEKAFLPPEFLVQEVKGGNSLWSILEKTLDNNDKFKGLTLGQKAFVLSNLTTNEIFEDPENYGLTPDGTLEVGSKINLTKFFEDPEEVELLIDKAKQAIPEGSRQEASISQNTTKINDWFLKNPGENLDESKVAEILNPEIKTAKPVAPMTAFMSEESGHEFENEPKILETPPPIPAKVTPIAELPTKNLQEEVSSEIATAKARLGVLEENNRGKQPIIGLRSMANDSAHEASVSVALEQEVDGVYGKSGILGIGKINGVDTKEWGQMRGLPAKEVLEYFRNPEASSNLPKSILQNLQTSEKHRNFVDQMNGLMRVAGADFKPFEKETAESFTRRLGGFIMKQNKF